MSGIRALGVEYSYSTPSEVVPALRGVNLDIMPGDFVCLFGASGSGKSTLLSLIAGLDVPSAGCVDVLGTTISDLPEAARTEFRLANIGIVFQEHNLISQLTAVENVELILRCRGVHAPRRIALEALDTVGLAQEAHRRPLEMSGGQRQRVGVARAIAGNRPLVLCDEPTGSLDSVNGEQLFQTLHDLTDQGITIVVATHDSHALKHADTELVMLDGAIVSRRSLEPRA